ncbi:ATP-binding SpoIIE family protein phosphatase [Streptomyces sp. DSM 15324]|uniref:ATP-binding SpoIIE family protein phosphatase n=1 Tax=Streptomyces sp. DSM 15324 TaxID=1739111 RepID=UPI00074B0A03|nr:ATP-binding SpoIIE family protein phosphatase [Streptomyces sp. DSM 15324]KUO09235.1 phosphatase [Streptomyces sp. DSM 15324]
MARVWDVPVHDSTRVRDARVAAEDAAALAGLDESRTAAAALIATELATNLLKHAGGGQLLVEAVAPPTGQGSAPSLQIAAVDHGPGIADVPAALVDGFSTTGSLGAGLGTCRRLADAFAVDGSPGRGTVALARLDASPQVPAVGARVGGINVPFAGAAYSGDLWTCVHAAGRLTLMLADGLGHGPEAARASTAAAEELRRRAHLPPAELLGCLDGALRGTRGAAVAVAQLDPRAGRLRFAGVGNTGARLYEGGTWRPLLSRPGIVGVHRPGTVAETEVPWAADRLLILHTDGLPSRWVPPSGPGLPGADPAVTAAVTVRDAGSSARPVRDDTAVAVLSPDPPDLP